MSFRPTASPAGPAMLSQSNEYVLLPPVDLTRSYTKESDGGSDLESPPARPIRYNKPVYPATLSKSTASSPSASAIFSFAPSHSHASTFHSHSNSLSHSSSSSSSRSLFSFWWPTVVSCLLTCVMTAVVTAVAVLLFTTRGVRLAANISPPTTPSFGGSDPLDAAFPLGVPRTDSRTLLSVSSAASSFPTSHIPSIATALPSSSPASDASIAALRGVIAAGKLVEDNLLIVGVVNFGYLDFALNWLCFARRHGIHNYLLVAIDDRSVQQLTLLGYGQHVMHVQQLFPDESFGDCGGTSTHAYRTLCFNRQTELKSLLVLTALLAGHNVLLSDMDISFVHNPLLYMPLSHYWEMQLEPVEWCTGLYFVQSNPFTVQMESGVIQGIRRNKDKDDQEIFNKWITYHRLYMPDVIDQQLFPLDRTLFPIGKDYGQAGAVIQHNNWVFGADEKRQRQRKHGLYLFNHNATQTAVEDWVIVQEGKGVNMTGVKFSMGGTGAAVTAVKDTAAQREWVVNGELLQCDVCVTCDQIPAAVAPLRTSWPGKSTRESYKAGDGYRGPSNSHP